MLFTIAYDRKELAVISLLGGFAAPFLVTTGEGNFRVLFTYLLILDMGMLVLANFKKWHIINVLSFTFTALIFGATPVLSFQTGIYLYRAQISSDGSSKASKAKKLIIIGNK